MKDGLARSLVVDSSAVKHRHWSFVMIVHSRLVVMAALLVACQPEPADDAQATEIPPASPPEAASPELLSSEGWQGLRIGMTRQQVVATLGEDANPDAVGGADPAQCDEFRPVRAPEGMLLMLERGRLTRISLGDPALVETEGGLAVGDSAARVRRHYGERVRASPHKYVAAPAEYLTVWSVAPPATDARGVVYEVGGDGLVARIHAGGPSIQYVEGCL